jgi:phospholipid/cholesterol/gamma-HCH transport system substrate-binding protein
MQKQAPSATRLLIMVAFAFSCFGLILFLWLAFGGTIPLKPKGYEFKTSFSEATQLAKQADVRISGVPVGKVEDIKDNKKTGRSDVTIEMDRKYAPIRYDARAILRQKTLLGETYVELTPGTKAAKEVPEDGRLPASQISPTVELDEIFRTFNKPTRLAFQTWMQSQAKSINGRGIDISDALGNLAPFSEDTERLLRILNVQRAVVRRLVSNTGDVFAALTSRDGQLRSLIQNSNLVFKTTANRDQDLADTFVALPTFENEARKTLDRLDSFAHNANPLLQNQLRPSARELSPTLVDLGRLAPDLKGFFHDINPLITASRTGLPAARKVLTELRPVLGQFAPFLRSLNPALQFLGLYTNDIQSFFANTVASTEAVDFPAKSGGKPVHYLRTTNPVNPEVLAVYPTRLGTNRTNPYVLPRAFDKLAGGLDSFEVRHCGIRGLPVIGGSIPNVGGLLPNGTSILDPLLPASVKSLITGFVFGTANNPGAYPTPPCRKQASLGFKGQSGDFPHLTAEPPGK